MSAPLSHTFLREIHTLSGLLQREALTLCHEDLSDVWRQQEILLSFAIWLIGFSFGGIGLKARQKWCKLFGMMMADYRGRGHNCIIHKFVMMMKAVAHKCTATRWTFFVVWQCKIAARMFSRERVNWRDNWWQYSVQLHHLNRCKRIWVFSTCADKTHLVS